MVSFQVINIDAATRNQPRRLTVVATFATKAQAEQFQRTEGQGISVGVRPTPTKVEPIDPRSGLIIIGGKLGTGRTPRDIARERLGQQAIEKVQKNIPISQAERDAARRLTGTNIQTVAETRRLQTAIRAVQRGGKPVAPPPVLKVTPVKPPPKGTLFQVRPVQLRIGDILKEQRVRAIRKPITKEARILKAKGVPLTLLGIPRRLKIPKPKTALEKRFTPLGLISPRPKVERELPPEIVKEEKIARARITGVASKIFLAELIGTGLPRAAKAVPAAGAFGILSRVTPVGAAVVGVGATILAVPTITKEIKDVGLVRAAGRELPSLLLFAGAGKAGTRLKARADLKARFTELTLKGKDKLTSEELIELGRFQKAEKQLRGTEPPVKNINLKEVENLPPKAAKALDKFIVKNKADVVVGGSVATNTQIFIKARRPGDVDLFTSVNPKTFINKLAKSLEKEGVERVSVVKNKQITIKGKKAIEVKDIDLLKQNIKRVQTPLEFNSGIVKTNRGVRVLGIGIQARRKIAAGFELEGIRRVSKAKDIIDFPIIAESLFVTKEIQARRKVILPKVRAEIARRQRLEFLGIPTPPKPLVTLGVPKIFISKRAEVRFGKGIVEEVTMGKPLKRKPTPTLISRLGKPVGRRGALPLLETSKLLRARPERFRPSSLLRPGREVPSRIPPALTDISKLVAPPAKKRVPSVLVPVKIPRERPSFLVFPPKKEVPSALKPTPLLEAPSVLPPVIPPSVPSVLPPSLAPPVVPSALAGGGLGFLSTTIPRGLTTKDLEVRRVKKPGFDVKLRKGEKRGSKFVRIAKNLPKNRALAFGARMTDNFIEASFMIKRSGKTTTRPDLNRRPNLDKFRGIKPGSILPGKTIVEKKGKRLDRINEVRQISFFKEQARRQRISGILQSRRRLNIKVMRPIRKRKTLRLL